MAKKMKNCSYKKGYKSQNKQMTIMADDIYPIEEVENLNREKTFPLVIKLSDNDERFEINGNRYYLFSEVYGPIAFLDVQYFLLNHKHSFIYFGGREMAKIYEQEYDEAKGELIIRLEDNEVLLTEILSDIIKPYFSQKMLTKKSNDC